MPGTHGQDDWWTSAHRAELPDKLCAGASIGLSKRQMQPQGTKGALASVEAGARQDPSGQTGEPCLMNSVAMDISLVSCDRIIGIEKPGRTKRINVKAFCVCIALKI